jgi:hypothetical protein
MTMSEDEMLAVLSVEDARQVFTFRFTDGTQMELMDCWVRIDEDGMRECLATIVRTGPGSGGFPGEAISFLLSEVADIRVSARGFDYWR